jgi:DNA-binding transcriptional regulator YiaG
LQARQVLVIRSIRIGRAWPSQWETSNAMTRQPEHFPETVKEVRRQLALSHKELPHALGVSFATVNRWETGKTVPSKLAQATFKNSAPKWENRGN